MIPTQEQPDEEVDSIVLSNIPRDLTEDDVREYFQAFGKINEVKVMQTKKLGVGFVKYTKMEYVDKALRNGKHVKGEKGVIRFKIKDFSVDGEREIDAAGEIEEVMEEKEARKVSATAV